MQRSFPKDPSLQRVKGVFIFKDGMDGIQNGLELLKTLQCEIISSRENRITVSASRGNLQNIKQSWLSKDPKDDLSRKLNHRVMQIIIGGNLHAGKN